MKWLAALLVPLLAATLAIACGEEGQEAAEGTLSPGATPSASRTVTATPGPGTATPESEADRALAAAEVVFGGVVGPNCTPTAESPVCILPLPSAGTPERGIAAFQTSFYPGGGAIEFLGKTPEGEWQFWFGTQDITYQLTVLPGEMRVCAGGEGLNLRASPSVDSESLALLNDDEVVAVDRFALTEPGKRSATGAEAGYGWYQLTSPEEGWAYSKYLSDASLGDCSVHDALVPSATPTPAAGADPEDFGEFADLVAQAAEVQDTAFFAGRVEGRSYTCSEADFAQEGLGPASEPGLCQEIGQQVEAVEHWYWRSEGLLMRPSSLVTAIEDYFSKALPEEEDDYGPGAVRLYAIGKTRSADPERTYKAAILTAITPDGAASEPVRTVRAILLQYVESRWVIRGMEFATVGAEEFLSPETAPFDEWERY
jgi:hypothetical protein